MGDFQVNFICLTPFENYTKTSEKKFLKGTNHKDKGKRYNCSTILKAGWVGGKESKGKESKGSSVLNLQWKEPRRNSICFADSTKALELAT